MKLKGKGLDIPDVVVPVKKTLNKQPVEVLSQAESIQKWREYRGGAKDRSGRNSTLSNRSGSMRTKQKSSFS